MSGAAPENVAFLAESLGRSFTKPELLTLALTHRSFANEEAGGSSTVSSDNERLEFLGDAVLDLALSAILMVRFESDSEGALSKKRASLVNEETLSLLALELKLDTMIRLGKGEAKTGGVAKPRILASTFEAVLGACYLDGGFPAAYEVVERIFATRLEEIGRSVVDYRSDFKTRLQEKAQDKRKATPIYQTLSESGPDHDKIFEVAVLVAGETLAAGRGKSKKAAEQDAARQALELLEREN